MARQLHAWAQSIGGGVAAGGNACHAALVETLFQSYSHAARRGFAAAGADSGAAPGAGGGAAGSAAGGDVRSPGDGAHAQPAADESAQAATEAATAAAVAASAAAAAAAAAEQALQLHVAVLSHLGTLLAPAVAGCGVAVGGDASPLQRAVIACCRCKFQQEASQQLDLRPQACDRVRCVLHNSCSREIVTGFCF